MEKNKYNYSERSELLGLVPESATKILDVGCGSGLFSHSIKKRQSCEIIGVEPDHAAAKIASGMLDHVYIGTVEQNISQLQDNYFDFIILADVLEHLLSPELVLTALSEKLTDNGAILISIPNFDHYSVIKKILYGNFAYELNGILDNTHISFLSLDSFLKMINNSGLKVKEIFNALVYADKDDSIINLLAEQLNLENFFRYYDVFQFFILTEKVKKYDIYTSFSSIILRITAESFEKYQQCLESISNNTKLNFELIFIVSNLSTEMIGFLENIPLAKIIHCQSDSSDYYNFAVTIAQGDFLLFISRPVLFSAEWLEHLLEKTTYFEKNGAIFPQRIILADSEENHFSDDSKKNQGLVSEKDFITGSCFLLKKELYQQIGGFDPLLNINSFEKEDYSLRMRLKNYKILAAKDVYTYELSPFIDNRNENSINHFREKWDVQFSPDYSEFYLNFDLINFHHKFISALKNPAELTEIYSEMIDWSEKNSDDLKIIYYLVYLECKLAHYHQALANLQKLFQRDGINREIFLMFSHVFTKINNSAMSDEFRKKADKSEKSGFMKNILADFPL